MLMFNRRVIYRLKRLYGCPVVFHKLASHSRDVETGVKSTVLESRRVGRAIVLRSRHLREFTYDLAFISANKDFTTGGFYDPADTRILVDSRDLGGVEFTSDDLVAFDNTTAQIKEAYKYPSGHIWSFFVRAVRGHEFIAYQPMHSGLILTNSVTSVLVDKLSRSATSNVNLNQDLIEVV